MNIILKKKWVNRKRVIVCVDAIFILVRAKLLIKIVNLIIGYNLTAPIV